MIKNTIQEYRKNISYLKSLEEKDISGDYNDVISEEIIHCKNMINQLNVIYEKVTTQR